MSTTGSKQLDPYTAKAEDNTHTPQEKIQGLHAIVKGVKTGMLTTRSADGHFHARAMAPAGRTCFLSSSKYCTHPSPVTAVHPDQVNLVFIANRVSAKFEEIENDAHVNVAFYDEATTNWASYSGIAKITQDKTKIAKHWSSA